MDTSPRPEPGEAVEPTEPAGQDSGTGGDVKPPPSGGPPRPALIGLGVVAAIAAILLVVFLLRPDPDPAVEADASPTVTPASPTAKPTAAASTAAPESTPSPTAEPVAGWQGGSIPVSDAGTERVHAVTPMAGGFVAVGINYPEGPPFLVAVPLEGRVWHSTDGRSWEDATPPDTFADAMLNHIFVTADDALIVIGAVAEGDTGRPAAWESADGITWSPTSLPFPSNASVTELEVVERGHLALLVAGEEEDLWLSADGRTWEMVRAAEAGESFLDVGAGDDGFVAVGARSDGDATETFAIASSDGQEWIEASAPPMGASSVVAQGGDWIASGRVDAIDVLGAGCLADPPDERVWSSQNGLEWTEIGSIRWSGDTIEVECWYLAGELRAAGSWLISSTRASPGPCCDIILTPDEQRVSSDGAFWELLPFPAADRENGVLGSSVNDAVVNGAMLILVGESGSEAAFWFNEAP